MTAKTPTGADSLGPVSRLIDAGNVDTVYRDVYLQRARTLLAGVLSAEEFRSLEQQQAELATLPLTIGRALDKADWAQVKALSERMEALRKAVNARRRQVETARGVFAVTDMGWRTSRYGPFVARSRRAERSPNPLPRLRRLVALKHAAMITTTSPPAGHAAWPGTHRRYSNWPYG